VRTFYSDETNRRNLMFFKEAEFDSGSLAYFNKNSKWEVAETQKT